MATTVVPPRAEEYIGLKVMRLATPPLHSTVELPSFLPISDPFQADFLQAATSLNSDFGTVYMGELFRCFISVSNLSNDTLKNIRIRVEIQTTTDRLPILNTDLVELPPSQSSRHVLTHTLSEVGQHCLVCHITFIPSLITSTQKVFQKFFKFPVQNPLRMKTGVFSIDSTYFAEMRVTNLIPRPLFIKSVRFHNSEAFQLLEDLNATALTLDIDNPNSVTQFHSLKTDHADSFVFKLKRLDSLQSSIMFGHFEIRWHSVGGESGRLLTEPLVTTETKIVNRHLSLSLINPPSSVTIFKPFEIFFSVGNSTERALEIRIEADLEKMGPILPCGTYAFGVGSFKPKESKVVSVKMMSFSSGMHKLTGFRLRSYDPKITAEFDNLCDIVVLRE